MHRPTSTLLALLTLVACGAPADPSAESAATIDPDLTIEQRVAASSDGARSRVALADYAELLATFVDDEGRVHYLALRTQRAGLDRFVASLSEVTNEEFAGWSRRDRIAFLINAYNAIVLRTIVEHHPIEPSSLVDWAKYPNDSIRQLDGVFDERKHLVAGESLTLDDIEEELRFGELGEPRVHAALVCGAASCPPLRGEPYLGARLDAQLADQARRFVADTSRGIAIDLVERKLILSRLFDWYRDDFADGYATDEFAERDADLRPVLQFLAIHATPELQELLANGEFAIEFMEFDWSQNRQQPRDPEAEVEDLP
jgi:hypothetical protein